MSAFPVLQSTLSPKALATWLEEQFGLQQVRCQVLKTNMNHTYMVHATDRKAVLRVYAHAHRTEKEIAEELRILQMLHSAGLPVSYPYPALDGAEVQQLCAPEGTRFAVLFSYAEGQKLRYFSSELSTSIGILMGSFHKLGRGQILQRVTYTSEVLADDAIIAIAAIFPDSREDLKYLSACALRLSEVLGQAAAARQGILHLDMWYDNMSIDDEGHITLYDFDNLGNGPLVLDLGYYCMQLYYIETDKAVYKEKKSAFIEGYRSVLPVEDAEQELIPFAGLAIWIHYLGLQAKRFDYSGNLFLSANYLKMYLAKVKEWLDYHGVYIR